MAKAQRRGVGTNNHWAPTALEGDRTRLEFRVRRLECQPVSDLRKRRIAY